MIKFFRKIRQKMLTENKFSKYLLYAIGEIILVVIGILIALQINNWNEGRKEKSYLHKVYAQIQQDLQTDTLNVRLSIEDLQKKNARLTAIVERNIPVSYYDTLNQTNYNNCEKCTSDITNLIPFQNLDKGYQLLKALNTYQNFKEGSLTSTIDEFYSNYLPMMEDAQENLLDLSKKAIEDYQQFDWFVDWAVFKRKTYNKAFILYIFESEKNRKESAHYLIFSKFTLRVLKEYQENSIQILKLIDEKLKE
jgi:hypothetical protein